MVISEPLGIVQWIETTLLTLINYPNLVSKQAIKIGMATKEEQFGIRRAQLHGGWFSSSKYTFIGEFDGMFNA